MNESHNDEWAARRRPPTVENNNQNVSEESATDAVQDTPQGYRAPMCLDCLAATDGNGCATHNSTCPTGRGIDRVCAADAEWFTHHRQIKRRWRAPMSGERAELAGVGITGVTLVRVHNLGRGRHVRTFFAGDVELGGVVDVAGPWGWAA